MKAVTYLKARLRERSSWVAFVAAVTAASLLTFPWDIVAAVCGVIGVLAPEPGPAE